MNDRNQLRNFGQVMLFHLDAAYNLARWLVRDPWTVEDVVHEACGRASRSFASFRGESVRTWLLCFVREACYARLGQHALIDDDLVDLRHVDADLEDGHGRRYDTGAIDGAIAALPTTWRECVVLRDMEGLSYTDMARIIDAPVGTVITRLVNARHALQRVCAIGPVDSASSNDLDSRITGTAC